MRRRFSVADPVFFTSDPHYFHKAAIKWANRPFKDVEDMNNGLIHNWNAAVPKNGHTFILGDLSFGPSVETMGIISRLNGTKYLILGNHDKGISSNVTQLFDGGVQWYHEIRVGFQKIVMCHFPFRSWNGMHHGAWNLHGHCHGNLPPQGKQLDVGVDVHNWTPISYWQVHEYMKNRKIEIVDHHGAGGEK